jgi:uncharacterized protein YidB (DUF937 family)
MGVFDAFKNIMGGQQRDDSQDDVMGGGLHQVLCEAIEGASAGGMGGFMAKLHEGGLTDIVSSWAGGGQGLPISGDQLRSALGDEHIQGIASRLGLQPDQALDLLQDHLPALAAFQRPASQ